MFIKRSKNRVDSTILRAKSLHHQESGYVTAGCADSWHPLTGGTGGYRLWRPERRHSLQSQRELVLARLLGAAALRLPVLFSVISHPQ